MMINCKTPDFRFCVTCLSYIWNTHVINYVINWTNRYWTQYLIYIWTHVYHIGIKSYFQVIQQLITVPFPLFVQRKPPQAKALCWNRFLSRESRRIWVNLGNEMKSCHRTSLQVWTGAKFFVSANNSKLYRYSCCIFPSDSQDRYATKIMIYNRNNFSNYWL